MKFRNSTLTIGLACTVLWGDGAVGQQDPGHSAAPSPGTFNHALQRILSASKDRFIPIEGSRIENRRREFYFEPKVYLPDATYCRIFERGTMVYACEWERAPGRSGLAGLYDNLVEKIEAGLGPEWSKKAGRRQSGQETLFTGENRPTLQVIRKIKPPGIYVLVFPAGSSQRGLVGELPSLEDFAHP